MADLRTGSKYLHGIEEAVEKIQLKKDIQVNLEIIRKYINAEFKATCERVILTKNDTQSYFFGAHVFPSKKELYKIADKVIRIDEKVQFENCTEFILELDSKLVYDIGATPREIVAVILHEIGHKVYSKQAQIRTKLAFINTIGKYGSIGAGILKIASPLKFLLFTAIVVSFSNSVDTYLKLKDETDADSFAVKYGYGSELYSLLTKLTGDNAKAYIFSAKGKDDSEKAIMRWSFKNIMDFSLRRAIIIRELEAQYREEPSEYGKEVIKEQLDRIKSTRGGVSISFASSGGTKTGEKLTEAMLEESLKSFAEVHSKGMSWLEVDEINVEVERIETYEDKMYLISRIYRNISLAEKALQKEQKKSSAQGSAREKDLKEYLAEMNKLLEGIRSRKIKDMDYGVFVRYPVDDYERQ